MSDQIDRRSFLGRTVGRMLTPVTPTQQPDPARWLERLKEFAGRLKTAQPIQGSFIILPEYRPDIASLIANELGFTLFDFRREVMADRAWDAGKIELPEITQNLETKSVAGPVPAFNIEALLSTKADDIRKEWAAEYQKRGFSNPVISILTLYGDIAQDYPNTLSFEIGEVPEHTLLRKMFDLKQQPIPPRHPVTELK